jgi:hypothetical protein
LTRGRDRLPSLENGEAKVLKVVALAKRMASRTDDPGAVERELAELRADIALREAEAARLEAEWLAAPDQAAAEEIAARRSEISRMVARDNARIPELEVRLAAVKAAALRERIVHHRKMVGALVAPLARALETAAETNSAIINPRQAAIDELGERLVIQNIPLAHFAGLVLPDLVEAFVAEQAKIWSAPWRPPEPPPVPVPSSKRLLRADELPPSHGTIRTIARPGTGPALDKLPPTAESQEAARRRLAEKPQPPPAAPPVPPMRPPRRDPPPAAGSGKKLVRILRGSVELADGFQCRIGDVVALAAKEAERLVLNGAGDFVAAEAS